MQAIGKYGNKKDVVREHKTDKIDVSTADSTGDSMSVSDSIRDANNVLYHKDEMHSSQIDSSVFEAPTSKDTGPSNVSERASCATSNVGVLGRNSSSSNTDIMNFLVSINNKICTMDTRLNTRDILEQKVSSFDNELKNCGFCAGHCEIKH